MRLVQLAILGLLSSGVTIIVALGFQLIFSTTRMFHFAYAAVYSLAIYVVYATVKGDLPLIVGLALSALGVVMFSALIEWLVYRPMRASGASQLAILIASLGILTIAQAVLAIIFGNVDITIPTPGWLEGNYSFGSISVSKVQLGELVADALIYVLLAVCLRRTAFGQEVRAVADDPFRAKMLGIDVNRVVLGVLLIGALVLVPTATLAGMDTGITPYASVQVILVASIIMFVGGLGSMGGTFAVAVAIGIVSGLALQILPSQWVDALSFAILVLAVLVRPRGIFLGRGVGRRV